MGGVRVSTSPHRRLEVLGLWPARSGLILAHTLGAPHLVSLHLNSGRYDLRIRRVVAQVLRRPSLGLLRNPSGAARQGRGLAPSPANARRSRTSRTDVGVRGCDLARHEKLWNAAGFRSSIVVVHLRNSAISAKASHPAPAYWSASAHARHMHSPTTYSASTGCLPLRVRSPRMRTRCSAPMCM